MKSSARALTEGGTAEGRIRPCIAAWDRATYVNYHRVRIDPKKAEDVDKVVTLRSQLAILTGHLSR